VFFLPQNALKCVCRPVSTHTRGGGLECSPGRPITLLEEVLKEGKGIRKGWRDSERRGEWKGDVEMN